MNNYKIRKNRLSKEINKKISIILQQKISDNRIKNLYVIHSNISKDLSYAKIFINSVNKCNIKEMNKKIKILQKSSKFIKFFLSKMINLRCIPKLHFVFDKFFQKNIKIINILKKSKKL